MRAEFRRDESHFFLLLMKQFISEMKDVKGYVVYYKDAFKDGERDDAGRTYLIDNALSKAVIKGMDGRSVFAKTLDGKVSERIDEDLYVESKYIEKLILEAEERYVEEK